MPRICQDDLAGFDNSQDENDFILELRVAIRATVGYDEVSLPFKHPDFVLQGVFLATESFLVDYLDCVHLTILLRLRQPHL